MKTEVTQACSNPQKSENLGHKGPTLTPDTFLQKLFLKHGVSLSEPHLTQPVCIPQVHTMVHDRHLAPGWS